MTTPSPVAVRLDLALLGTVRTARKPDGAWQAIFDHLRFLCLGVGATEDDALLDLHAKTWIVAADRIAQLRDEAAKAEARKIVEGVAA